MNSNLLARDPLSDVKDAFAIVSREGDFFLLNGYPVGFKRNPNLSKHTSVVKKLNGSADVSQSASASSGSILMLTVGHPNGTLAKITAIGSLRLANNVVLFNVLVVPEYNVSLLLPSSVLSGASPFRIVYGREPSLSHLRAFRCLCYPNVLNNNDKFGARFCETTFSVKMQVCSQNICESEKLSSVNYYFSTTLNKSIEPNSYYEASKDDNWITAMNKEIEALHRNNTWILTDLPIGRKAIGCKRIFKIKYKSSGEIGRYKARLVAKGYSQREGIDYEETFSPVVKMVIVRCLISLDVSNNLPLFQLDDNNSFMYGDLHEEVHMSLPPSFYDKDETKVCRFIKSLYGLKQAPRQWNEKLTCALIENSFIQSKDDHSLYVKSKKGLFIALLVYVDDIVITSNDLEEIENFNQF
ncbi:putative RNA-directed DNA polymerase [Tanacetum coccineum]